MEEQGYFKENNFDQKTGKKIKVRKEKQILINWLEKNKLLIIVIKWAFLYNSFYQLPYRYHRALLLLEIP